MSYTLNEHLLSWIFAAVFFAIGVLNLILVHPVPGLFYLLLMLMYLPSTNAFLRNRFGFPIPFVVKIVLFLIVMWATLAVGDLAEMYGL